MAVPKYKTSRSKRDMRRSHIKLKPLTLSHCSSCQAMIRPHRICPECGSYKGVQVLEVKSFV